MGDSWPLAGFGERRLVRGGGQQRAHELVEQGALGELLSAGGVGVVDGGVELGRV